MLMTHYMELLATNQPWNLIIFMAIPVILAETIAVTELFIFITKNYHGKLREINRRASKVVGIYFLGVFMYLFQTAVIPLTVNGQWRGLADVIAVGAYLLGVIPLLGISLLEYGVLMPNEDEETKFNVHAVFVAIFLVVAHVAMIFGMVNPALFMSNPY